MTLKFTLTKNDYLQHQLFIASQSVTIKKQRRQDWLIYTFGSLILSLLFYQSANNTLACFFLIIGIIAFCLYPTYLKGYYKRYYQQFIEENYKDRFDDKVTIDFLDNHLLTADNTEESKMNNYQISAITETGGYTYLSLRKGGHLIIPKKDLQDLNYVRDELQKLAKQLNIKYDLNLDWKWE